MDQQQASTGSTYLVSSSVILYLCGWLVHFLLDIDSTTYTFVLGDTHFFRDEHLIYRHVVLGQSVKYQCNVIIHNNYLILPYIETTIGGPTYSPVTYILLAINSDVWQKFLNRCPAMAIYI